ALEPLIELEPLAGRHADVVLAVEDQGRRGRPADDANRRQAPVGLNLLVDRTEVAVEDAANIGGALEADPVGDPGAGDGRLETIAVGDGPVGQEAATAPATDDELVRVGDSLFDQVVHSAVDVLPVGLAVAADDAAEERGAAAGGAARVGQ